MPSRTTTMPNRPNGTDKQDHDDAQPSERDGQAGPIPYKHTPDTQKRKPAESAPRQELRHGPTPREEQKSDLLDPVWQNYNDTKARSEISGDEQ